MRLRELHLERFGHFTDRRFDFGTVDGRPDFHIIHGLNEAGKTTTMEAVLRLFYGFPNREPYAFKHQRSNLKVSAIIENKDDSPHFTRLPKRSGSLVDASGIPLPETAIAVHLGGLTENDYRNLLCLDDDTIERGGEEIAQARGDMGRLLFSAAAGVADLSTVLDAVREEAGKLWRKHASKTRMAELKRERASVERDIRDRDVTASAWRRLRAALSNRCSDEDEARSALDQLRRDAAQVAARRRSLPLLADIERLERQIAPFADYPERLDFDPERLVVLLTDRAQAHADAERLVHDIAKMTEQRETIRRMPDLLKLSEELDSLEDLRSRNATARMDLARRRSMVTRQEAEMTRAVRDLDVAEGVDPSELVLSPAEINRLETSRDTLRDARRLIETESNEVADLTERLARAQTEFERQASQVLPDKDLGEVLVCHDTDRLAPAWAAAQQAIDTAEVGFRNALDALKRGVVGFDALPDCPATEAQARSLCEDHDSLARQIETVEDVLAQHRETAAARNAEAKQLTLDGSVVSDVEADALKDERERLWQEHRQTLTEASANPFEAAMRQVDGMMQARLAHARDLGRLRQIEQAEAEANVRSKEAAKRLDSLCKQQTALEAEINANASEIGLPIPMPPGDWHDWVVAHAAADVEKRALERIRSDHAATLERPDRLLEVLRPLVGIEDPEFDTALFRARDQSREAQRQTDAIAAAKATRAQLEADLAARKTRLKRAQKAAESAVQDWETIVADLLGGHVTPASLQASLDPLRSLREAETMRVDAAWRVKTMEDDQTQFAAEVENLAAAYSLPEAETPAETFDELRAQAKAAEEAEANFTHLSDSIKMAEGCRQDCQTRLDEIAAEQQTMGRIFPEKTIVDTIENLREATIRAQQVISDRTKRVDIETTLLMELSVPDLDAARTLLDGADPASLEAEADSLATAIETAETALTRATEARVTAEQALSQVTGDAEIAALTERRAVLELQMEEVTLEHLELHLGYKLAEEAIRRYRDTHRSGMMAATERSFAALTHGAYTQLKSQPEGDGEALLAVDVEGTAKRVAEMSKSTRFQLYLALRAAAHEQLVTQGVCLPFFCDDIFETFDEERTSAACRVMEQIGRTGQAIYLTHHRHVLDIAETVCDTAPLVHEL